jgi:hypothetical protein
MQTGLGSDVNADEHSKILKDTYPNSCDYIP